ncbi:MAG: DNA polymerase III subunit beta [Clostridiales bacterium]|nr:DNA polymerase III subunit beta [Clostridiales bacterium]
MKLVFNKNVLLDGINIVSKAIPSRTTMDILECILIDADTNEIKLTGNDMELGIETKVEGTIEERGKIALDARLFYEIVRKLPDGGSPVAIHTDEKFRTTITCESSVFHIQGRDGEEFSYLPYIERDHYISLTQFSLKEAIRQTIFSIAPNDSNKMMRGELMEVTDDILKIVSLDGHRISIRNLKLKDHYEDQKVIVPGKTLSEISKILSGDNDREILIFFSKNHILFEFDNTIVVSRLIEGNYFRIDHMISHDYTTRVRVNKRNFSDTIDRAMTLIRDSDRKPLILNVQENTINMKVNSTIGSMNEDVSADKTGNDIMIAFNPKFLMEALRVIDDEEVDIYMTTPKSPCFIRDDKESYIYLILPVNFIASDV